MRNSFDIFISYRRDDGAEFAEGLANELKLRQYKVFFDKESIPVGKDFPKRIHRAIAGAKEFIIINSKLYFGKREEDPLRRIDNKDDWVRQEIGIALENRLRIHPINIDTLSPEPEELPEDIRILSALNFTNYDRATDTYKKIVDVIEDLFEAQTRENAVIGAVVEHLTRINIDDNERFNEVCKEISRLLEDRENSEDALRHILDNKDHLYNDDYRFTVFYTLFSHYRRGHEALKVIELTDSFGSDFKDYSFFKYVLVEYHHLKFKLSGTVAEARKHLEEAIEYSREAVELLPDNNGIVHSFAVSIALALENGVNVNPNDVDTALRYVDAIIEKNSGYAIYYCTKARLLMMRGEYEKALLNIRMAETLETPTHKDWGLRIAEYYNYEFFIRTKLSSCEGTGE